MKRIAVFAKYGMLAASSRQRLAQYAPYLAEAGFELEYFTLLDDSYLNAIFSERKPSSFAIANGYLKRVAQILTLKGFSAIWLHTELFPYLPGPFEQLIKLCGIPIIYDFDDAIFHQYDAHPSLLVRKILGGKLKTTLKGARLTLAGNEYLAEYARRFCREVEVIPTVVDTSLYQVDRSHQPKHLTIGWIGSPSTWQLCKIYLPTLRQICEQMGACFKVIGAGPQADEIEFVTNRRWREADEIGEIQSMTVGVMPLDDSPFALGKCGYKLIQYMACGIPVVASPVGVNAKIVDHGVNGFLASTDEDWHKYLTILLKDKNLARRMGAAGRRKIEAEYSLKVFGPRVAKLFQMVTAYG